MIFKHESVLRNEVIELLNIKQDGLYVDGTLGGGGHSFQIASRLSDKGHVLCIDQDEEAIEAARKHLRVYEDRTTLVHDNFVNFDRVMDEYGYSLADGFLLDLGVSSYQLDNAERGFSYMTDAPLDMRMDRTSGVSARTLLNSLDEEELTSILYEYGEERFAPQIARLIVKKRQISPLETTGELAGIVREAIPKRMQEKGGNPCKRTFQAVRIACNRELDVLSEALDKMVDRLAPEGRIAVITFHSLEDRIVKNAFKKFEDPCTCPPEFPVCVCGKKSKGKVITRKPVTPTKEELEHNPRAASAKLRVFEKVKL